MALKEDIMSMPLDDPRRQKTRMTSCGNGSSHGPHNMGWTRCSVHAPNVKEEANWFYLG
jgi:hypothetical protein